ncbi:MAG: hypothetical protein MI725_10640, partial [Pirellulales bacterium]|nr:hypothetical protein [Pirellulales bacterium]
MASRENQNLQIVVISLTILLIIVGGLAIWLNGKKNSAQARADQASAEAQEARNDLRKCSEEADTYKQYMGFPQTDAYETMQESFAEDMQRFGGTFDENNRFYRTILENIYEENRKLAQGEVAAKAQVKDLKGRLLATEKEKDAQIASHVEKEKQA